MIITLLTDYGLARRVRRRAARRDPERSSRQAQIVDITHAIRRHDIRHGALTLRGSLPYMPVGVHVAIVDPQVGTERRAVAVRCADGRLLVGPDNGLLSLAWEQRGRHRSRRSTSAARPTASSRCRRPSTAATCSRRWPRGSPPERRSQTPATRSRSTSSSGSSCRRRAVRATRRRHALDGRRLRQRRPQPRPRRPARARPHARPRGSSWRAPAATLEATSFRRSRTSTPASRPLYEDAFGTIAIALNRGDAARRARASSATTRSASSAPE